MLQVKKINEEKNIISASYHRYVCDVIKSNMLYSIGMMFLPLSGGDPLLKTWTILAVDLCKERLMYTCLVMEEQSNPILAWWSNPSAVLLSPRYYFHAVVQKEKITSLCLANAFSDLRFCWEGKLMSVLPVVWGKVIHKNSFHKLYYSVEKSPDNDPSFLGKLSLTVWT